MVKNVAKPPRISRAGVEPRWVIWKKESNAPRTPAGFLELPAGFLEVAVDGMALSVERPRPFFALGHIGLSM